jgi:biopolymer transport protein ExbD
MSLTLGSSSGQSAEMNVTPLIDVLLVLLIIFLLIIPSRTVGETADIPLPEQKQPNAQSPETAIVVDLRENAAGKRPALTINQQKTSWENLEASLEKIYKQRAQKTAFLKSDSEIDFEYVAEALDVMHRAGAEQVGLISTGNQ